MGGFLVENANPLATMIMIGLCAWSYGVNQANAKAKKEMDEVEIYVKKLLGDKK